MVLPTFITALALTAGAVASPVQATTTKDVTFEEAAAAAIAKRTGLNYFIDLLPVNNGSVMMKGVLHTPNPGPSDIQVSVGRLKYKGKVPLCNQAYDEKDATKLPKHRAYWDLTLTSAPFEYFWIFPDGGSGSPALGTLEIFGPGPNGEPCGKVLTSERHPLGGCHTVDALNGGKGMGGMQMTCLHYYLDDQK